MSRQEKIESLPLEKISEDKIRISSKKIVEIETIEEVSLTDLINRKSSIEKAIQDTEFQKGLKDLEHAQTIMNLNMQVIHLEEKISEAKGLGLKEDSKNLEVVNP